MLIVLIVMDNRLNPEQRHGFSRYLSGRNFFLTGGAGTGKSFLLKTITNHLRYHYAPDRIGICGLTGVSAIPINGRTLHSWAGIGLGDGTVDVLYRKVRKNQEAFERWKRCRTLIIDEVSMMSLELFEKLHWLGVRIRNSDGLFGGMQIILSGDFLQLPPVRGDFCFQSKIWDTCFGSGGLRGGVVYLHRIVRQEDSRFHALLSRVRLGMINREDKQMLVDRKGVESRSLGMKDIKPTRLYPYKKDVELINELEIEALLRTGIKRIESMPKYGISTTEFGVEMARVPGEMKRYRFFKSEIADAQRTGFNRVLNRLSPADYNNQVSWCVGAQVMLTHNLDVTRGLVNGSRGVVVEDRNVNGNPMVRFILHELDNETVREYEEVIEISRVKYEIDHYYYKIGISQYPLMLAWAMTIHKAQSATLDCVETDLSEVFSPGQTYVTLSRVRDLNRLYLLGINFSKIRADQRAVDYYNNLGVICSARRNQECIPDGVRLGHPQICISCLRSIMSQTIGDHLSRCVIYYL